MPSYREILSRAWADHLAPVSADAPTVVSTFAGAGGSSLGYSMAGFRELLAVEWEGHAAACLRRNFPHVRVFHGDIADVDAGTLDLAPGELDVLDGSPPCQGFSMSGKRNLADPRNQLFREYVRLLDLWQPKVFVMENVTGMIRGKMKPVYREVVHALRNAGRGYEVSARVVDASLLGVPQKRQRLVFIGVDRSHSVPGPLFPRPKSPAPTVRDAIGDLRPNELGLMRPITAHRMQLVRYIRPGENGGNALKRARKKDSFFNTIRLDMDRPAKTLTKSGGSYTLHPRENRCVSAREMTRLQSFPDEYNWGDSTYTQIQARVGNSVPPLMMRAIATNLRASVLPTVPR